MSMTVTNKRMGVVQSMAMERPSLLAGSAGITTQALITAREFERLFQQERPQAWVGERERRRELEAELFGDFSGDRRGAPRFRDPRMDDDFNSSMRARPLTFEETLRT